MAKIPKSRRWGGYIAPLLCWCLLATGLPVLAQTAGLSLPSLGDIRQEGRPEIQAYAGKTLVLDDLATLSLLVSDVAPARLTACHERLLRLTEDAKVACAGLPADQQGEALLKYLHGPKGTFKLYSALQTRVDTVLDTGSFNCVSSAIIYYLCARALDLPVGAVGTTDHAFCVMDSAGKPVDVETTIPYGYDPGRRQDFRDSFGKLTGFVWVPPSNYADRQLLNERQLLALVLQNRSVDAEDRRDDITPVGLAWDNAALTSIDDAKKLLQTAYHNRAATLNDKGDYLRAMAVILAGEERLGVNQDSGKLFGGVAGNAIQTAMGKKDWSLAQSYLLAWRDRLGTDAAALEINLFRLQAQDKLLREGWAAHREWLRVQPLDTFVTQNEINNALDQGVLRELSRISANNNWENAWVFLQGLDAELRKLPETAKTFATIQHNLVATIHNNFARLANAGKTAEAQAVLEAALQRFPDDSLLKTDYKRFMKR